MKFENYYFLSSVDWPKYLQAMAITGDIDIVVSNQTRQRVASDQALARSFGDSFSQVAGSVKMGFAELERSLEGTDASIDRLRSDFNYHAALLLDELRLQRGILLEIADRLDAIHQVLLSPMRTRARELYGENQGQSPITERCQGADDKMVGSRGRR